MVSVRLWGVNQNSIYTYHHGKFGCDSPILDLRQDKKLQSKRNSG
jgi:hypothetical protein